MKTKDLKKHLNNLVEEVETPIFDASLFNYVVYQPIKVDSKQKNHKFVWGLLFSFVLIFITLIVVVHIDDRFNQLNKVEISMSKTKKTISLSDFRYL